MDVAQIQLKSSFRKAGNDTKQCIHCKRVLDIVHESNCGMRIVKCHYCKQDMTAYALVKEHTSKCPQRPVKCPKCNGYTTAAAWVHHQPRCSYNIVTCRRCSTKLMLKNWSVHKESCPGAQVSVELEDGGGRHSTVSVLAPSPFGKAKDVSYSLVEYEVDESVASPKRPGYVFSPKRGTSYDEQPVILVPEEPEIITEVIRLATPPPEDEEAHNPVEESPMEINPQGSPTRSPNQAQGPPMDLVQVTPRDVTNTNTDSESPKAGFERTPRDDVTVSPMVTPHNLSAPPERKTESPEQLEPNPVEGVPVPQEPPKSVVVESYEESTPLTQRQSMVLPPSHHRFFGITICTTNMRIIDYEQNSACAGAFKKPSKASSKTEALQPEDILRHIFIVGSDVPYKWEDMGIEEKKRSSRFTVCGVLTEDDLYAAELQAYDGDLIELHTHTHAAAPMFRCRHADPSKLCTCESCGLRFWPEMEIDHYRDKCIRLPRGVAGLVGMSLTSNLQIIGVSSKGSMLPAFQEDVSTHLRLKLYDRVVAAYVITPPLPSLWYEMPRSYKLRYCREWVEDVTSAQQVISLFQRVCEGDWLEVHVQRYPVGENMAARVPLDRLSNPPKLPKGFQHSELMELLDGQVPKHVASIAIRIVADQSARERKTMPMTKPVSVSSEMSSSMTNIWIVDPKTKCVMLDGAKFSTLCDISLKMFDTSDQGALDVEDTMLFISQVCHFGRVNPPRRREIESLLSRNNMNAMFEFDILQAWARQLLLEKAGRLELSYVHQTHLEDLEDIIQDVFSLLNTNGTNTLVSYEIVDGLRRLANIFALESTLAETLVGEIMSSLDAPIDSALNSEEFSYLCHVVLFEDYLVTMLKSDAKFLAVAEMVFALCGDLSDKALLTAADAHTFAVYMCEWVFAGAKQIILPEDIATVCTPENLEYVGFTSEQTMLPLQDILPLCRSLFSLTYQRRLQTCPSTWPTLSRRFFEESDRAGQGVLDYKTSIEAVFKAYESVGWTPPSFGVVERFVKMLDVEKLGSLDYPKILRLCREVSLSGSA